MNEKNYIASSIKAHTTQYGTLINANLKLEDLTKIEKNGWVQITIAERKTPSEKGATHYATENKYQAKPQETKSVQQDSSDIPFQLVRGGVIEECRGDLSPHIQTLLKKLELQFLNINKSMKDKERKLMTSLQNCNSFENILKESKDIYSRFDAYDNKGNIYELKCRDEYYDDVVIEFDKFSYNFLYCVELTKKSFFYVVQMPEVGGVVFDITQLHSLGHDFRWQRMKMPKTTEFGTDKTISKIVGFIPIKKQSYTFIVK